MSDAERRNVIKRRTEMNELDLKNELTFSWHNLGTFWTKFGEKVVNGVPLTFLYRENFFSHKIILIAVKQDMTDKLKTVTVGGLVLNDYEPSSGLRSVADGEYVQVTGVKFEKEVQGGGVAKQFYKYLVSRNFVVVSDREQYKGAIALWRSLARDSVDSSFRVMVYNDRTHKFVKDPSNSIEYTGENINPAKIWGGKEKRDVLLYLTTRG